MTAPEHPVAAPPGWYPDPDGAAGMVRWWDGARWSDVATPEGPGVAVGTMTSDRTAPLVPAPAPQPPVTTAGGSRTAWIVGLALLALVAVALAMLWATAPGGGDTPAATAPSAEPEAPGGPTFPPGTVRIVDDAAGISYPHLGAGWFEYDLEGKAETLSTAGQYFVTQEDPPSMGLYLAECVSGPVADGYGWTGPATLPATTRAVADSARSRYYPAPHEQRVLRDEPMEVDGHPAHLLEIQLSWDVPGYDATGERAALLLVDVGRDRPALLFVSIPNTHAELYGVIDRVIDAVEVL